MKIKLLIVSIICAAVVLPAFALAAPPQLPHIFYGNATNNGNNVPVNTVIIAKVNGVEKSRITVTEAGKYGGPGALDEKLLVQGNLSDGAVISFYIGNNNASQTVSFESGKIQQLNLTFSFDKIIVSSSDLPSLISNGTFSVSGSNTSASSISVVQPTLLNVGSNSITLPQGVVITKVGGGNFDATALTAAETSVGSLSGLGSGVVAKGALQWGIASLGLEFNPAIIIKIYVGTSLNGQTLDVVRSISGSSGWTNDGIVAPATCVVASGYCSFSATKASYYVASQTTTITTISSGGGGGGGGGGAYTPTATTTPAAQVVTPAPTAPTGQVLGVTAFNFASDLKIGMRGEAVTELQKRLTSEGVYSGPITGYFGPLTLAGTKAYQKKYGISQTGFVGPLTRAQLNKSQVAGVSTVNTEAIRKLIESLQAQVVNLLQQLLLMLQSQVKQ